jgi:membrane fusion protein, multidrug efflux system
MARQQERSEEMKGIFFTAALLIILACGGEDASQSYSDSGEPSQDSASAGPPEVAVSARLESDHEALLFGSGRVTGVFVAEGDSVESGQILVSLSGDAVMAGAVAASRANADAARIEAENGERDLQRCLELFEAGAISEQDLDGARTSAVAAGAMYRAALAEVSGSSSGRDASILQAPFSGVAGRVWAREGGIAGAEPLVMLTGGDGFVVRALLPERFLGTIEAGAPARFETEAIPGISFEGQVLSVSPSIDPVTCLLPVTLGITDQDGRLASGLYGMISIFPSQGCSSPRP